MKITYNWLKDFVEIKIKPQALADKLTMAGLEVTSLEEKDGDFIFEMEITSNRPDLLSVIGIAREVAAITGKKFLSSHVLEFSSLTREPANPRTREQGLSIKIEDKKDCPLYTAKIIKGVKVGPSPDWLKKRLELVGCRAVNNIVDITNYIMFIWGEPLHAFDLDKLSQNSIVVRRAKKEERLITIDGEQRMLNPDILVIADKEKAMAIAGVMGGLDTEISKNTQNVLLEAALFNPVIVRRSRQRLGLESESAYRFERGIDSGIIEQSSMQAVKLIQEIAAGKLVLAKSAGRLKQKKKSINLNIATVKKILDVEIKPDQMKSILNNLDFKVKSSIRDNFKVEVPPHRLDVDLEMDLVEEIARIFGYENIPNTLPKIMPRIGAQEKRDLILWIKNILAGLGLNEVITYGLVDKDLIRNFNIAERSPIEILNPLSSEQQILRPALIPSLSRCVAYNLNQKQTHINIFEIAKVFVESDNPAQEKWNLGIALCGTKSLSLEQGVFKEELGFLHLKGILEVLLERLGVKEYKFNPVVEVAGADLCINQEKIGRIMRLSQNILDYLGIKNKEVWLAEVLLDKLLSRADLKKRYHPLPRYPEIIRDISFIIQEEVSLENLLQTLRDKGRPLLRQAMIVDYYKGRQIPSGFRGLTISCFYRSDDRTLTETEINPLHNSLIQALKEQFQAQIR